MTFNITSVGDIKWNNGAFESLVLPNDHKELILALTESQVANKDSFDDVIQGKGILAVPVSFSTVRHKPDDYNRKRHDYAPQRTARCWQNANS